MPSPSTHQESPKVPPGGWPKLRIARPTEGPDTLDLAVANDGPPEHEVETYISVSALLSDEVVEVLAKAAYERSRGPNPPASAYSWEQMSDGFRKHRRVEWRTHLQVAIDHLGGKDRG